MKKILAALLALVSAGWFHHGVATRSAAINLSVVDGGQGIFINNFKNCGSLSSTAGYAFPLILNADGYPTSTPTNTLTCNISNMPTADNPQWIISWSGTLKLVLQVSGTPTINSDPSGCATAALNQLTLTGANCVVGTTFASAPASMGVQFPNSGTYSNPSNLSMVRSDELTLFNSGEIFRPVSAGMLLAKVKSLGATAVRFINWNNIATQNNASQWAFLNQATALTYAGTRWELTVFGATPITGTNTYAGPATSGSTSTYVDGQVYQNVVTNANTSTTPTLSVGGGPAVTIVNLNATALSTSGNNAIAANSLNTFIYDATLNEWLWSSNGLNSRVPISIDIALCNKLSISCWMQIPTLFTLASMTSLSDYVRDNANLTPYMEFSNEVWNPAASPNSYITAWGTGLGFPNPANDGYALKQRQAMGIVTTEFGPKPVVRVLAWQIGSGPSNSLILNAVDLTLQSNGHYCSGSGCTITTNYTTVGQRPIDFSDAFAYAPYYQGAEIVGSDASYQNTITDALTAADNYASGNPALMSSALDFVDCDIRGTPTGAFPNCGSRNGSLGGITLLAYSQAGGTYPNYEALAVTWGKTVIEYEGGYQALAPSASRLTALATAGSYTTCQGGNATACSTAFSNLIAAYKNDSRFTQLVYDQMKQMIAQPHSRATAWYEMGNAADSQWTMFPGNSLATTPYKSFNGFQNYTAGL